ncbi:MAG TPA: hypothetical protein VH187_23215 [Scandinavium sp.]|uniref:hypothetical protein n=1 Tax=Scandinavium sp. TaxID=2830653 RepID=UPI002E3160A5|nr:hypothetical protein [Scandinavium sp.]HEX4504040.1 hypothetical protein [Scandinavium sp.]
MDNILKKEEFILSETVLKRDGSFIYELHNNHFFNKDKLSCILAECELLPGLYKDHGKSENYTDILKGIVSTFQHIFFLISCHFMPDDDFIINNYDADLSSEIISDYYIEFRLLLNNLII